ncbi:MAG: formate dehydrogenase [Desulfacinum sp.]|nr:formate dehydrogenase [Desulfacinum sp.]
MDPFLFVDFSRCIACQACRTACRREHGGVSRLHLLRFREAAVPLACRQCRKAPCAGLCPEGALVQEAGRGVRLLEERCTRCGLCAAACPFGVLEIVPGPVPDLSRCDLCRRRWEEGLMPVCVLTCPTRALSLDAGGAVGRRRRAHPAAFPGS